METIRKLEQKLKIAKKKMATIDEIMPRLQTGIMIDLTGPEGNVFYILGLCKKLAHDYLDDGDAAIFTKEILGLDYKQILDVCQKWFGLIYITEEDKRT